MKNLNVNWLRISVISMVAALLIFSTAHAGSKSGGYSATDVKNQVIVTFNKFEQKTGCYHQNENGSQCLAKHHNKNFKVSFGEEFNYGVVFQNYINSRDVLVEERGFMVGPVKMDSGKRYAYRIVLERSRPMYVAHATISESFHVYVHEVYNGKPSDDGVDIVNASGNWINGVKHHVNAVGRITLNFDSVRRQIKRLR